MWVAAGVGQDVHRRGYPGVSGCVDLSGRNTVQLGARCSWNTGSRWTGRLWQRLVPVPLYVPLEVLELDDPRVRSQPPCRIEPSCEQPNGVAPTVVRWPEGDKSRAAGIERRAMRRAATKLIRSGSTPTCSAASHIRVRMA